MRSARAAGQSYKTIAAALGLDESTIRRDVKRMESEAGQERQDRATSNPRGRVAGAGADGTAGPSNDRPTGLYSDSPPEAATARTHAPPAQQAKEQEPGRIKQAWQKTVKTARVLADGEVEELQTDLIIGIRTWFDFNDKALSITNRRGAQAEIWSTIPDNEVNILAEFLIERGRRSAVVAHAVRSMVDLWRTYAVALILAPAFWESFVFYMRNGIGFAMTAEDATAAQGRAISS